MNPLYCVRARSSFRPVWEVVAESQKQALDIVAAATCMPRHCLIATFVSGGKERPKYPEDNE